MLRAESAGIQLASRWLWSYRRVLISVISRRISYLTGRDGELTDPVGPSIRPIHYPPYSSIYLFPFHLYLIMSIQQPGQVPSYKLSASGIIATILPYGGVLQSLVVKDKDGKDRDIVVGFDDPLQYVKGRSFDGAVIG